jgi:streptogramin lyase
MIRLLALLSVAFGLVAGPPPAPSVSGARSTTDTTPTFSFKSKGARSFECGVDTTVLKKCAARYTAKTLAVGAHKLRVRAVNVKKRKSRVTTVAFVIKALPPPPPPPVGPLAVKKTVALDGWPGNPLIAFGSVWIPSTQAGTVTRLDALTGELVTKIATSRGSPTTNNYFDSLAASSNAIWEASDAGGFVTHIDPATNSIVGGLSVFGRPSGIAIGAGSVWVSLLDGSSVLRIDPAKNEIQAQIDTGETNGITFANGSVWAVSGTSPSVFRIDPATNTVVQTIGIRSDAHVIGGAYELWWAAGGSSGVWVANQQQDVVTHLDTNGKVVAQIPLAIGFQPYSIAVDGNFAWAVNSNNLVRIDATTNAPVSTTPIPAGNGSGIFGVAAFGAAIWVTNYDKNEAYLIGQ